MSKAENLIVGKRYWLDEGKDISGVFKGRFNPEPELDYLSFNDIIKTERCNRKYYTEKNGDVLFGYMDYLEFPEYEITYTQLELTF